VLCIFYAIITSLEAEYEKPFVISIASMSGGGKTTIERCIKN